MVPYESNKLKEKQTHQVMWIHICWIELNLHLLDLKVTSENLGQAMTELYILLEFQSTDKAQIELLPIQDQQFLICIGLQNLLHSFQLHILWTSAVVIVQSSSTVTPREIFFLGFVGPCLNPIPWWLPKLFFGHTTIRAFPKHTNLIEQDCPLRITHLSSQ